MSTAPARAYVAAGVPSAQAEVGVGYWSPARFGFDALVIDPLDIVGSALVMVAGFNSFMAVVSWTAVFAPAWFITIQDANNETATVYQSAVVGFPGTSPDMALFGAHTVGGIASGNWSWHTLQFLIISNDDVAPITVTARLYASRRHPL